MAEQSRRITSQEIRTQGKENNPNMTNRPAPKETGEKAINK